MQDITLHYDVKEDEVCFFYPEIDITIADTTVKLRLTMCYQRPDLGIYHLEYRQMED